MSIAIPPTASIVPPPTSPVEPRRKRWTREEYVRLAELGAFEGQRVELIAGEIIEHMSPQGEPHSATIVRAMHFLIRAFGPESFLRIQMPLAATPDAMPEPDLAIVAGKPGDSPAPPNTALLVIEVADSSLAVDRGPKSSLYAAAGVPDYWIVDLPNRCIEVRRTPIADAAQANAFRYATTFIVAPGQTVAPLAAPQAPIDPADLLP